MTKRKPVHPDAAVAGAVDFLMREFRGLDLKPNLDALVAASEPFTGPIVPTVFVAASNARPEIKAMADFVCSGTDDQDEINAAIEMAYLNGGGWGSGKGGRVVLSAGEFNTTREIFVGSFGGSGPMHLMGMGPHATVITAVIPASGASSQAAVHVGDLSPCSVSDLSIAATMLNNDWALDVENVNGGFVRNIEVQNGVGNGAVRVNSTGSLLSNVNVLSLNEGYGFYITGSRNRLEHCRVDSTETVNAVTDPAAFKTVNHYNTLTNCLAETGCNFAGFEIGGDGNILAGCQAHPGGAGSDGIVVTGSRALISGCQTEFPTGNGIFVVTGTDSVVSGCTITDPSSHGIRSNGQRTVITGNAISGFGLLSTDIGIRVDSTDCVISGNTINFGTGEAAIRSQGVRTAITGNVLNNPPGIGISAKGADSTVVGNVVFTSDGDGIYVGAADITVIGNVVDDAGDDGILVDAGTVLVDGNRINNPTGDGIEITALSTGTKLGGNLVTTPGGSDINDLGTGTLLSEPLTTKGDLYGYGTAPTAIPVGADDEILTPDSAETTGLKWIPFGAPVVTSDPVAPVDGQLIMNSTDQRMKVAIGGVWYALTTDTGQSTVTDTVNVTDTVIDVKTP